MFNTCERCLRSAENNDPFANHVEFVRTVGEISVEEPIHVGTILMRCYLVFCHSSKGFKRNETENSWDTI